MKSLCFSVKSLSKHQLSAALKRICLNLDEKVEILDFAAKHPELGYRKLAEHFSVGKPAIASISKQGKTLRKDFEFFKGTYKTVTIGNTTYWMKFCITSMWNVRVQIFILIGPFCKKKQWGFKKYWIKNSFTALIRWLESLKRTHRVREKRSCGEADDVSTTTIEAWIEQLPEFCQGCQT